MGYFLYWVRTDRRAAGAGDGRCLVAPMGVRSVGPVKGESGLLVFEGGLEGWRCRYDADGQEWVKLAGDGGEEVWVGVWLDDLPGPEDLRRGDREFLAGPEVELGDGRAWTIPRLRLATGQSGLPSALSVGPEGEVEEVPLRRYRELCRRGERVWAFLMHVMQDAAPVEGFSDAEMLELLVDLLAVNYRLGMEEARLLELLTSANLITTAGYALGYDLYLGALASKKKTDPGGG